MLNGLKKEIFFLKKMMAENYSPASYWRYFKNKFFGSFPVSNIGADCKPQNDFELHCLCQKKDLQMLYWALKSFLYHSGLCPQIIIHDDGSIDPKSAREFSGYFSNLRIISKKEADDAILNRRDLSEKLKEHRQFGHSLILKLVDIFLLSQAPKVMILDSDVLFFNKPQEIIDFVENEAGLDALAEAQNGDYNLAVDADYLAEHNLHTQKAAFINSGLILFKKGKLSLVWLLEYFKHCLREPGDYWVEMAGWGSIIAQTNFNFLPLDKYIIKGKPQPDTIMKHFTQPRRHEFYAYGIDMVKKMIYGL